MALPSRSARYKSPAASNAIVRGPLSGVPSRRTIRRRLPLPGAGERVDNARRQLHPADTVVADVADEQAARRVEGDAVRLAQLRAGRRPAVTGEPGLPGARETWKSCPVPASTLRITWLSRSAI